MSAFTPTDEWQDVPDDAVLPPGCEVRTNDQTGRRQARLAPNGQANDDPDFEPDDFDFAAAYEAVQPATNGHAGDDWEKPRSRRSRN